VEVHIAAAARPNVSVGAPFARDCAVDVRPRVLSAQAATGSDRTTCWWHSDFGDQDREFKHTSNRRRQSEPPQAIVTPDTGYSTDTEPRPSVSRVEAAAA
jgi:hypothetical protein